MPSPNVSQLQFYSGYPIDKIVVQDTATYTVVAPTLPAREQVLETIANPYGAKCLIQASWSIDNTNFNSTLTQLQYYNNTEMQPTLKASVNCGCDDSNIYFFLTNGFTSNLTFNINYTLYSIS